MIRFLPLAFASLLVTLFTHAPARADWPQFRGPDGQGHAEVTGLPLKWSESQNVAWKTPLPGRGWSSPVIEDGRIWMTAAIEEPISEEERKRRLEGLEGNVDSLALAGAVSLRVLCVDLESGKLLKDTEVLRVDEPEPVHTLNSYASPTPIVERGRLYCHFGTYGTICLDTQTHKVLWKNSELNIDHQNGPGSSPILWGELIIFHCDGMDLQYIAALDKQTGKLAWKTDRSGKMDEKPPLKKAYCTPLVVDSKQGPQLISPAADWLYSYDPATGKELWRAGYGKLGFSTVPRPVAGHGMVYICTSFMQSRLLAVRYDGQGDVTDTHVAWHSDRQIPKMPSPLLVGDELYVVSDSGIATCFDAHTGEELWRERLGGNYSASPLLADGRIYFFSREGDTTVIRPGKQFELLAANHLDGQFMASAAIAGKGLILRTDGHLYRIED
ncbi:MAG: PQQ-binding-like beta-propeller repeat protein [Pirellulaceae bacterium]